MKNREVIHKIIDARERGIPSDDSRLRPRRVYSALVSARARTLADSLNRTGDVSDFNYTTLSCVELEQTTAHECGCIPVDGCTYLRTKCELPAAIGKANNIIRDVTSLDGTLQFSHTDWGRTKYQSHNKYTSKSNRYFIRNNRLYLITTNKRLKWITIRGIFEDPVQARLNCNGCNNSDSPDCTPVLDTNFDLDQKYIVRVLQLAYAELFGVEGQEDKIPDTNAN